MTDLLPLEEMARLRVTADSLDQYDLMRAITRCDELVNKLRAVQLIHSQNLCRVANHIAGEFGAALELAEQHYHRGDGKPGYRNAPPCTCQTPNTETRP